ncbi:MAG: hypothetical protein K2W81_14335 [Sphingomonas sp.]|uniref:hypothetical protein n=1 Tax=Sphingomonas sp. TaxID=28214 RepID=UPI0025DA03E2|nr:hypothetical protein [Sphingomonas sp.]MBY0285127.1 hypothetical protein [Sphingomonas sp.]
MVKLPPHILDALQQLGVDPELLDEAGDGPKVVVVRASLDDARQALRKTNRDQTIMARVDEATASALDDWVKVGAAKSRSEAAALFLREGLKVRADDLARLSDALAAFEEAEERLKREGRAIFGDHDI